MTIIFTIHYNTCWGENICIAGNVPAFGNSQESDAAYMQYAGSGRWEFTIDIQDNADIELEYRYIVKDNNDNVLRREWGSPHRLTLSSCETNLLVIDHWKDIPEDATSYSSAFTDGFMRRTYRDQPLNFCAHTIRLSVEAPSVRPDESLAIVGDCPALGNWNPMKAVVLNDNAFPVWEINLKSDEIAPSTEYKFIIIKKLTRALVAWEEGSNRTLRYPPLRDNECIALRGLRFRNPLPKWKAAGVAIPVFSIRTDHDFGCGDFVSIKKMADWCAGTGQKIIQLLPVNDTSMSGTWRDSYPYNSNSTFALNPLYLRPEAAGGLKSVADRQRFSEDAAILNALPEVDYEKVACLKIKYMKQLYSEQECAVFRSEGFKRFFDSNSYWLKPYATWCVLRDTFGTPDHNAWGEYSITDNEKIEKFCESNRKETGFYFFLQYHLDKQLREARDYAHSLGIVLKGDIPIGISRTSVDAWSTPEIFNLNEQAGAPPDAFAIHGQNWGFPTYNWDKMAEDDYRWWKSRFKKMADYFDAYRIDHILGFFRIWQIPFSQIHGLLGFFNKALPFTPAEMRNEFDFYIIPSRHAVPSVAVDKVYDFFGDLADSALDFLVRTSDATYVARKEFSSQKNIMAYFSNLPDTSRNRSLRDIMIDFLDNTLFIEDPDNQGHYHPRINAFDTQQYSDLDDYSKWCYSRLYDNFFYHRNVDFWGKEALNKLPPLLNSTGMLACGEDLGMIPSCVPDVMEKLRILSLEIQRMPKDPDQKFTETSEYPYLSVCSTSTHDMPGLRTWWEQDPERSQEFYNTILKRDGEAPKVATAQICRDILDMHFKSPSMLCIIPLQDLLSMSESLRYHDHKAEQINNPADPDNYWNYRMHLSVETLMAAHDFNSTLREMIADSGR